MKKLLLIILLIVGCSPITFSNIQSAKLVKKAKLEFTPSCSIAAYNFNYGIQMAYGLSEKQNLRFRLERIIGGIDTDVNSDIDPGFALFHYPVRFVLNHLSIGIKYQLIKNKSALYLPLSFTKPDAGNTTAMKLFEPTTASPPHSPAQSSTAVPPTTPAQSCGSIVLSHPTISNAISRSFFI